MAGCRPSAGNRQSAVQDPGRRAAAGSPGGLWVVVDSVRAASPLVSGRLLGVVLQRVQSEADAAGDIHGDVSVDSTSVRAHQARGRRPAGAATASQAGAWQGGRERSDPGGTDRPPGGGGAGGEALGRSRGGFTTKFHLSADGRCRPLSMLDIPGQRADCTRFEPAGHGTDPGPAPGCRWAPHHARVTDDSVYAAHRPGRSGRTVIREALELSRRADHCSACRRDAV